MQPSGLLRNMRNVVHNYTEVEIKVREATSNDPWGPSSSIMAEISDMTYQVQPFPEIMACYGNACQTMARTGVTCTNR